jgi:hypothetical protein
VAKVAFILGVVASAVTGVVLSGRLVHRDYTGSVAVTAAGHTCPTLGVTFDKPGEIPQELTTCACPAAPVMEGGAIPVHPPAELVAAAATSDQISIAYTEFTSPLNGKKKTGVSYTLLKGSDKQTRVVSSPAPAYSSFALLTLAPAGAGILLAILFMFMPKKEKGTGAYS